MSVSAFVCVKEGEYKHKTHCRYSCQATSKCIHSSVTGSLSEVILWKDTLIHNMWREGPPTSLDERRVTLTYMYCHPLTLSPLPTFTPSP